jgi:hypothetical protein
MDPDDYLDELDLTKLDFDLDIRDLSRELILTVKIFDDKIFAKLSTEAMLLHKAIKQEMARVKKQLP